MKPHSMHCGPVLSPPVLEPGRQIAANEQIGAALAVRLQSNLAELMV